MASKSDARKAEADARAAEARAKAATAEAEARAKATAAEADARARAAEAEAAAAAAKAKSEESAREAEARRHVADQDFQLKQDAAQREERQRQDRAALEKELAPWKTGSQIGALVGGMAGGHAIANHIEGRHAASLKAKAPEVAKAGKAAETVLKTVKNKPSAAAIVKLTGIVQAADKMGLTKVKGPLGAAAVGGLIADAVISRFVIAPQMEEGKAKAIVQSTSTLAAGAATTLLTERMVQNATLKTLPKAPGMVAIEIARETVAKAAPQALKTAAPVLVTGLKIASRAVPVVAIASSAVGAVVAGVNAVQRGEGVIDVAKHAALGAIGLDGLFTQARADQARAAEMSTVARARSTFGRVAAARSMGEMLHPAAHPELMRSAVGMEPHGDGQVSGYSRRQNGKMVTVKGYELPALRRAR